MTVTFLCVSIIVSLLKNVSNELLCAKFKLVTLPSLESAEVDVCIDSLCTE